MLISAAGGLSRCSPLQPAFLVGYFLALNPPLPRSIHTSRVHYDDGEGTSGSGRSNQVRSNGISKEHQVPQTGKKTRARETWLASQTTTTIEKQSAIEMVHNEDNSDDITRSSREARTRGVHTSAQAKRDGKLPKVGRAVRGHPARTPVKANLLDNSWRKEQTQELTPSRAGKEDQKAVKTALDRGPWDVHRLKLSAEIRQNRDARPRTPSQNAAPSHVDVRGSTDTPTKERPAASRVMPATRKRDPTTAAESGFSSRHDLRISDRSWDPAHNGGAARLKATPELGRPLTKNEQQQNKKYQPVGELSEQEKAMFQQVAREHHINMPKSPIGAVSEDAKTTEGAISILQELFPRELSRKTQAQTQKVERHVPKVPMDMPAGKEPAGSGDEEADSKNIVRSISHFKPMDDDYTILVLRKAGKHLTENDFRRLVPGSKHLEGWTNQGRLASLDDTNQGRLLRVIKARETDSLRPTGEYFLVFSNKGIATTYLEHVTELHRHSKFHSPRSTSKSIPPPPTLVRGSKAKFTDPAYTYNLVPSSHELSMRLVPQPFSPVLQRIVAKGGYPQLVQGRQSRNEVLLWFTSYWHPSFSTVRRTIDEDGKHRGSFWQTIGDNRGIRKLEDETSSSAPGTPQNWQPDAAFAHDERRSEWKQRSAFGAQRFIVSFKDEEEAARFVMSWHRRDVTHLIQTQLLEPWRSAPILGNAELTW